MIRRKEDGHSSRSPGSSQAGGEKAGTPRTGRALAFLEQSRPYEWSEEAQETDLAEGLQEVDDRVWQELLDVERALVKVGNGTYGICESCGADINPKRLRALSAARFCIMCQAVTERS